MNKRLHTIVMLLLCLFISMTTFAQTDTLCGFDGLLKSNPAADSIRQRHLEDIKFFRQHNTLQFLPNNAPVGNIIPSSGDPDCRKAQYMIPVVVHIIHEASDSLPGMGTNISDAQVASAIKAVNAYFANAVYAASPAVNTGIQFCLAQKKPFSTTYVPFSGITRRANTLTNHRVPYDAASLMALDYYPPDNYLNIWIVKSILDSNGVYSGIQGYSTLPYDVNQHEGVVMRYKYFGNENNCTGCTLDNGVLGASFAHELGHYLGLYHPFDEGCAGMDGLTCALRGDLCCDVPPVSGMHFGCNYGQNTCNETPDLSDQVTNIMDYSNEGCRNMFTANQAEIMHAVLNSSRRNLGSAYNLNLVGTACCHFAATFQSDIDLACVPNDTVKFTAIDSLGLYRWYVFRNDTLVYYTSDSTARMQYKPSTSGAYTVKLTVLANGDSVSFTRQNYFNATDCTPLKHPQAFWAFGEYCGLAFTPEGVIKNTKVSISKPLAIYSSEGSISQANQNGQMLFYGAPRSSTNNFEVYDKAYRKLNGTPPIGDETGTQVGIVIPNPGDGKQFYAVMNTANSVIGNPDKNIVGLRLSVFDTAWASSGNGGLIIRDNPIYAPSSFTNVSSLDGAVIPGEGITAIPKCNGTDYWLIVEYQTSASNISDLLVFSVTDSNHITYSGYYHTGYNTSSGRGQLKASPDGKYVSLHGNVFSFDRSSGTITGLVFASGLNSYGTSFSPDSRLVYMTHNLSGNTSRLLQFDLFSNDPVASMKEVVSGLEYYGMQWQLGPDNKLYGAKPSSYRLRMIANPNVRDTVANACGFTENGPVVSTTGVARSARGLPNMIDAKKVIELTKAFDVIPYNCMGVRLRSNNHCASSHKWYFGDGDSSNVKDTLHVYASPGTYNIKLVTPDTTIIKSVSVGNFSVPLAGDTLFCDTPQVLYFSSTRNSDYSYNWTELSSAGTFITETNKYSAGFRCTNEGTLRLVVKNNKTGCTDTTLQNIHRRVPPITGNSISSSQNVCYATITRLNGARASGGSGAMTYEWRKKSKGADWEVIPGATDTSFLPGELEDSTQFVRVAKSGGCEKASNIVVVQSALKGNTINIGTRACIPGQTFTVNGAVPYHASDTDFVYRWEYSTNGTTWNDVPPVDTNHIYYDTRELSWNYKADSVYVRRVTNAYPSGCSRTSNVLKLHPKIYIRQQPADTVACGASDPFYFRVTVVNETDSTVQYDWQRKHNASTTAWPTNPTPGDNYYINNEATSVTSSPGDSMRCVIITPCGNFSTRVATLYINHGTPQFATHPASASLSNGGSTTFTCGLNTNATRYGRQYYWQVSYDDGESWQFINGASDSFYILPSVTWCMSKSKYRVAVFNGCSGYVYSNIATLTVSKPSSAQGDLMMRDALDDNGTEPYPQNNIWDSPDIWFSRNPAATYDLNRNNIEYKLHDSGYVKVKIHNKAAQASSAYKVVLHWTKASTQELWTKHWLAGEDNKFHNAVSGSPFNGQDFYMGGVIDTVTIPSIAAFDSTILVAPWYVPNPAWFGVDGRTQQMMVCLLARILECDEKPYAMTYPERLVTADNAKNNKKIITKNLYVVDTASSDWSVPIHTGNYWDAAATARLNLKARDCNYFTYGEVVVSLDDALSAAWVAGGQQGTGITILDDHHVRIKDSCDAWLTGIAFAPNERGTATVRFVTDESHERTTFMDFDFDLWQYNEDSMTSSTLHPEGGMHIGCQLPTNTALHVLDNYIEPIDGVPYYAAVCPWATPPLLTGSSAVTPAYWSFQWQVSTDTTNSSGWTNISGATGKDYAPPADTIDKYYRRKAVKVHTLQTTYSPVVYVRIRNPHITGQPASVTVSEGDTASFTVTYQDMNLLRWQRYFADTSARIQSQSDTLRHLAEYCNNGQIFRAILRNACTLEQVQSSAATLTVTASGGNLWLRDHSGDDGTEPSAGFAWNSPDLVNRWSNDEGTTHQTPQYGSTNYLYVTVRNNGTSASVPARLYLYRTAMTTSGKWNRNYTFDTTQNACEGNWALLDGAKTGLGDLIGIYTVPPVAAGNSTRIAVAWNPPAPALSGNNSSNESEVGFAARIITCSDAPFGMNAAEQTGLRGNVANNSRIAVKNLLVTSNLGTQRIRWIATGNTLDEDATGKLVFHADNCEYFQFGTVYLHLDSFLQSNWSGTGTGFSVVDDSTLAVRPCNDAVLTGISYPTDVQGLLGIEFAMLAGIDTGETDIRQYGFILSQYLGDNDTAVGGVAFEHTLHLGATSQVAMSKRIEPRKQADETSAWQLIHLHNTLPDTILGKVLFAPKDMPISNERPAHFLAWTVQPNPFDGRLQVEFWIPAQAQVEVAIYDMFGHAVKVAPVRSYEPGAYLETFATADLAQGVYYATLNVNGIRMTKKVVLVR